MSGRAYNRNFAVPFHSGQTQKPTSHPLVSALKICTVQSVYGVKFDSDKTRPESTRRISQR